MTVVLIVFSGVIVLLAWWYFELFKCNRYLGNYPGPRTLPFVGNAHLIASRRDVIPVFMRLQERYGTVYKLMLGNRPRLMISDHKVAEFLLRSTTILKKSYEYKYLHGWLGTGLLTSSSNKWKQQRKLITPTFHFQILEQFIEIFNTQSDVLVKKLNQEVVDKESFDLFPYISLYALDIICEAAMGTSVNAQINSDSEYVRNVNKMCSIIINRIFSIIEMTDTLYPLCKDYNIEKNALEVLHGYTNYVITKRRDELVANRRNSPIGNHDDSGIKKRLTFLDLLLQCQVDGKQLPNEVIREEVDTFMFAGHDTTTSGISFTLYLLSKHPNIQEKVVDELRSIFGQDQNKLLTYRDHQKMKYLEMVIKESLRLYPSVPAYARILEDDVEFDGRILPKGLSMLIFAYGLHRNPHLFANPEKFDPERFSLENTTGRSPYAYLPFSAGTRNCIGQKFAMLEMKSTVSKILRNFELLPVAEHKPILTIEATLKSENGLLIYVKRRNF